MIPKSPLPIVLPSVSFPIRVTWRSTFFDFYTSHRDCLVWNTDFEVSIRSSHFPVRCACSTHLIFLGLIALSESEFGILCKQVDKVILCDRQSLTRTFPEELPRPRSAVQLMAVVRTKARRRASTSSRWGAEVKTVKSAVVQTGRYQMAPDGSWAKEQRLSFSFVHELRN